MLFPYSCPVFGNGLGPASIVDSLYGRCGMVSTGVLFVFVMMASALVHTGSAFTSSTTILRKSSLRCSVTFSISVLTLTVSLGVLAETGDDERDGPEDDDNDSEDGGKHGFDGAACGDKWMSGSCPRESSSLRITFLGGAKRFLLSGDRGERGCGMGENLTEARLYDVSTEMLPGLLTVRTSSLVVKMLPCCAVCCQPADAR